MYSKTLFTAAEIPSAESIRPTASNNPKGSLEPLRKDCIQMEGTIENWKQEFELALKLLAICNRNPKDASRPNDVEIRSSIDSLCERVQKAKLSLTIPQLPKQKRSSIIKEQMTQLQQQMKGFENRFQQWRLDQYRTLIKQVPIVIF